MRDDDENGVFREGEGAITHLGGELDPGFDAGKVFDDVLRRHANVPSRATGCDIDFADFPQFFIG